MKIKFTDECPNRLSRGPQLGILFVTEGMTHEVPDSKQDAKVGELEEAAFWLAQGWAVKSDSIVEKVKDKVKGKKKTGPVVKAEGDATEDKAE